MYARLFLTTLGLTLLTVGQSQPGRDLPAGNPANGSPDRSARPVPLLNTGRPDAVPDEYIVVFGEGEGARNLRGQDPASIVQALGLEPRGLTVRHTYGRALNGFAARLDAQNLARLRADRRVKYVEQVTTVRASATQSGATWGLDRIDQRNLPLDGGYTYGITAGNVTAYIIDTGINTAHTDFGGRAVWGTNTTGDGVTGDCQGHGTHVAGTVGSSTWGVAKGVKLVAVKVLGCDGSGTTSGVIAGINWAVGNKTGPAVANLSLGGSASQAVDDAISNATSQNLVMTVAAGNENQDACNVSPARAPSAITVGATTRADSRDTGYSNYGSCLDLFAPGTGITSTWTGSATATNTISGTSMAAPHVAGAAALILASNPGYTTSQVTGAILNSATTGKVTSAGTGSPNRLLYTGTGTTSTTPTTTGTTYTGSVSAGTSSWKPGTSGFSYAGGTLKGTLSGPSGTDFDLYLQRWNGSYWQDVAASEGSTSSESIAYAAGSGTYRWEVYAYSGSGSYTLTETK